MTAPRTRRAMRTGVFTTGAPTCSPGRRRRAGGRGRRPRSRGGRGGARAGGGSSRVSRAFSTSRGTPSKRCLQVQLAAVAVVGVHDVDDGLAQVGEGEEQALLHLAPVAAHDDVAARARVVAVDVELEALAELLGHEGVDEGDVVVDLPHLEDLLPAQAELAVPAALGLEVVALVVVLAELALVPAVLDLAEELDADLVGVDAGPGSWPGCPSDGRRSRSPRSRSGPAGS